MLVVSCRDCGRSVDCSTERHLRVPNAPAGEQTGSDGATETILCIDCGTARLNSDPSLPVGSVEVHAPTGPRR